MLIMMQNFFEPTKRYYIYIIKSHRTYQFIVLSNNCKRNRILFLFQISLKASTIFLANKSLIPLKKLEENL